jgi:E3 ubiquitin-protein ligase MYCBP2
MMFQTCDKILNCGHPCCGFEEEEECLPCLHSECIAKMGKNNKIYQKISDFCKFCKSEKLG